MKNCMNYVIPSHTSLWYKFRSIGITKDESPNGKHYIGGIGASELGTILYLNRKYEVALKIFNQKIGKEPLDESYDNEFMFHGRIQEPLIGDFWRCYDYNTRDYMENWNKWKEIEKT